MVQDPHIPGTLKRDVRHIRLYGRQQKFCCLREYWAHGRRDSGTACEVILSDHTTHLVSEPPYILRQDLRVQMPYGSASHIIPRGRLLPRILVKFLNRGEPPLLIQKGKGSLGPASRLLDWEWGCFGGLAH